jgi:N-acetylneuraminic acid mutarotase
MKPVSYCLMVLVLSVSSAPVVAQAGTGGTWLSLAPMPLARQELACAVLDGKVYVIAGFTGSGTSTSDVQVYDPATDTWGSAAPLPIATNHNAAAVAAGKLYAFGGTSNHVFLYSPPQNTWSEVAAMRFMHGNTPAVAVIDNRIYVAGGTGEGMTGNEVEVYDPVVNSWTTLAPMNVPRNHTAGGAINGKFYVAGGRDSSAASTALEVYDPLTDVWTQLAPLPTGRSGIGAGVVNGELYVFGGEIPRLFGEVEVYDPVANGWQQLPPMPTPRHGLFAAVIDNAIYLPGGATQQGLGATTVNEAFVVNPEVTRVVPIILDVNTGFAHYTTELTLTNRSATPVNLALQYEASLGARAGSGTVTDALAPGRQLVIPNILSYLRDKGLPMPALEVAPQQGGLLLVKFDGAAGETTVAATARTTTATAAPHPSGAAGLAYTALPAWAGHTGPTTIYGLRASNQDRSNVAVFNPTAVPVTVRLTAFSGTGDGVSSVIRPAETIPALSWIQISGVFNNTGITNGWVTVERVSNTGVFGAYGVVNDIGTSDGSLLLPTGGVGNRLTLPVLLETRAFRSELVLANRGDTGVTLTLKYTESLAPSLGPGGTVSLQLAPRQQQIIPEAIEFLRRQGAALGGSGAASYAGAARIEVSGAPLSEVFAGVRTAAQSATGGQFGVFTPAVYAGQEASREAYLFGLRSDVNNRSNVALVHAGGDADGGLSLEVQVFDGNSGGSEAGPAFSVELAPGQWVQLANPLAARGVQNGWVKVTRRSGAAPWVAYGVINDGAAPGERTGDGAFIPMTVPGF